MCNPYLRHLRLLPKPKDLEYEHNAVSLFAGGGGLDLGLAMAGFEIKFSTDIESAHCETITHNFPDTATVVIDANELSSDSIRKLPGISRFDLVAGGPPCQSFSILGQRNSFKDPRGKLVYEYVRVVNELKPKVFLFENVPGLLNLNKGKDWKELLEYFESETGYKIFQDILNTADFGIPQVRKRVFVVGFRSGKAEFSFPKQTHTDPEAQGSLFNLKLPNWLPAKFALENVDGLPNHRIRPHGKRVRERYRRLSPGARDKVDHTDRIDPERPSGTVLVGSKAGGGRPFIHPFEPRHLTVREAARLQSFPDWYVFQGTDTWQYRAVGNAVPPLLAKFIGEEIHKTLDSPKKKT